MPERADRGYGDGFVVNSIAYPSVRGYARRMERPWLLVGVLGVACLVSCSRKDSRGAGELAPQPAEVVSAPAPLPPPKPTVESDAAPPDFASMPKYAFDKASTDAFCRAEWTKRGELDQNMFSF
jgi:hypothetical protein